MRFERLLVVAAILFSAAAASAADVWTGSYDAATGMRYIPMELILGAPWDGQKKLVMPSGSFAETVVLNPSTWRGPVQWVHPESRESMAVYERQRRGVSQRFALRKDGTAIGRVSDTRFGIGSCEDEAKYPLGEWKQGETRTFESRCWYGSGERKRAASMTATITIEEADFNYGGVAHSLRIHWVLKRKDDGAEIDNRHYVFAPDRGIVAIR